MSKVQLSKEQAISLYDSNWHIGKTDREIVDLQLYQQRLCMPFAVFQKALENILGTDLSTMAFTDVKNLQRMYEEKIQ